MLMYSRRPSSTIVQHLTGAQVILESAASFGLSARHHIRAEGHDCVRPDEQLLVVSAKHPDSLQRQVQNIQQYLTSNPGKLRDVAYSLGRKRELNSHRAFCIADDKGFFEASRM